MRVDLKKMSALIIAAIFFLLDRLVKILFVKYYYQTSFSLLGDFLKLKLTFNPGIAFGLPLGYWLIMIATILILFGLVCLAVLAYRKSGTFIFAAWVMLLAGASSNLLDRIYYKQVIDYFDVRYFTVFNLADLAIIFSIAYLLIDGLSPVPKESHG